MTKVYSFSKVLALLMCMSFITHYNVHAQCVLQGTIADPGCGGTVTTNNVGGGQAWTLTSTIGADYTLAISGSNGCGTYSVSPSSFTASSTSSSINILAGGSCCWAAGGSASLTYTEVAYTNTTSNANICQGSTRSLTVSPTPFTAGTWSVIPGTGTGSISGTTFTAGNPGTVTIRYTKGSCNSDVPVTIIASPTTASVGANQSVCGLSTTLSGNTPTTGTGTWTQTAGPGVTTFGNANSGTSSASVTAYGTYTYQWSIANGVCTPSTASLTVTYSQTPSTATVGATQNICGSFVSGSLGGNTPVVGTGTWTQVSGPSTAVFSNANSGSSTATVTATGTYVFQWTISNGACTSSSATVTVNYYGTPTTATVGATQNICGSLTSTSLGGNSPAVGSGVWTQTSGPGTSTFSNSLSPTATATASVPGTYVYTWTISNGTCTPSAANITVNYYATPSTATTGGTQNVCGSLTSTSLGGNTPVVGIGTWTQVSGPSTAVFSSANSGSSTATVTATGTYVFQWTISNGTCTPSSATVTVNYYDNPTAATAGADQNICGSFVSGSLGGNTPVIGTGAWSQISGPSTAVFSSVNSGSSTATVSATGTYVFQWVITNGACSSAGANVTVNYYGVPTTATVGADQNICGSLSSNSLGGNSPAVGSGVWSQTSGPGTSSFSNSLSPTATATASVEGTYVYTWTISNGTCAPSSASITVNYYATPSTATVGATQNICGSLTTASLGGNTPAIGTGLWTQVSGPGVSTFSNATSGTSTATAPVTGTYVYQWTISNGTCTPSSATVTVNYYDNPSTATVGADQDVCGSLTSLALGGNTPVIGTGAWSQTSGAGVTFFSAANSGSSTASVSVPGTYVFTWTITNGTCTSSANVTVNFYGTPTIATVGSDQSVCGLLSNNLGGNTPVTGTGAWSQTSGPGTTVFSNASSGSSTATASAFGSYVYTWTISNGTCVPSTANITVNYVATPTGGSIANSSYCSSVGTGSVSVTGVSNATQYSWALPAGLSGSSTSSTITVGGSLPGTYTVTVTPQDAAFGVTCSGTPVTGTVTILGLPSIDSVNAGTLSCFGGSNDTITVYGTTSNGNLFYSIDGGTTYTNTTGVFPGLAAGNYTVYVKDDSSCAIAYGANPVRVTSPPAILLSIASYGNVLCNGDSSGYVNLSASGGTGLLTFQWNNGSTSQNISHIASGNFTVTATDQNGCTKTISQGITEPTPLTDSISATNVSCYGANDATATFVVSGGSPAYKFLWSTGDTSQTITNLNGAVYSVTATDNNGCRAVNSVNIVNPQPVSVTLTLNNVSCFGNGNGKVVANAVGGTGAYTYTWSPSVSNTSVVTNAAPGTYILTVSDVNNCSVVDSATVTQPLTGLSLTSIVTPVGCTGGSNGSINLLASGGSGGYVYNWSSGQSVQIISGLSAAIYVGSVTDANGCTASISDTLIDPTPIVSNITRTNVTCYGSHDGTASLTVSGGVGPYSVLWSNFDTTFNIARLTSGLYRVRITDSYGCEHSDSVRIRRPADMTGTLSVVNVNCYGTNVDTITANVTGGNSGGYTYTWSPSVSTTNQVTNVAPGTYVVTATDTKGCTFTDSATITQPSTALAVTAISTSVGCTGGSNGSINLQPTGGTGGYTYSWSSGQTTQLISGLSAATYVGSVTDANGCVASVSTTLADPTPIVSSITKTNVTCFGSNDGTASLTVSGGVAPYSVLWENFDTTFNITRLSSGLYRVRITDANGCEHSDSVRIRRPADMTGTLSVVNVSCYGTNVDTITANVTGGNAGGYTYTWSPSVSTTNQVTNVAPGTYVVTVTDTKGCTFVDSATITQPSTALSVTAIATSVGCAGGSNGTINLQPTGGVGGYTYSWSSGQTTQFISGLSAATYVGSVTDANGCVASVSTTLADPTPIVSSITSTDVTCFGSHDGTASLTVSGGVAPYSILWSNFDTTFNITRLGAGVHRVRITDANGCEHSDSVRIRRPAQLTGTLSVVNVNCYGSNVDTITANVTGGNAGGYTYTWSPSVSTTNQVTNVAPGTYVVTVTDTKGCTFVDSATITQPSTALSVTAIATSVGCAGGSNGSIDLQATGGVGGYTYSWSSGQSTQLISGLSAATYVGSVTDANGCVASVSTTLADPTPIVSSITKTNVTCFGSNDGTASLTVSGGVAPYSVLWSNFDTTFNITRLSSGLYRVRITDANGCEHSDSVRIRRPADMTGTLSVVNVSCYGTNVDTITANVTGGNAGGYTYTWSPSVSTTNQVTNVAPGTYVVTATDTKGCTFTDSATITQPASAVSVSTVVDSITCNNANNGSITVLASGGVGGYTYKWSPGAQTVSTITGLAAGSYTVTVTDGNGCSASKTVVLSNPSAITSTVAGTNVTCAGARNGSATLTVSGGTPGYTYLWSNFANTQNLSNVAGGTYRVIITDAHGCQHRDSVVIIEPQALSAVVTVTNVLCFGANTGAVSVAVTGGTGAYTYSWSPVASATNSVSGVGPGTYTVTITDANGCSITTSGTVTQPASAVTVLSNVVNVSCGGNSNGSISLSVNGGTPGYTYTWATGQQTQNITGLPAGIYTVTVADAHGCNVVVSDTVKAPTPITSSVAGTNVTCAGARNGAAALTVNGGSLPYTFLWSNFSGAQNIDSLSGGWYYVIITDGSGCQKRDSVKIQEPLPLVLSDTVSPVSCTNGNNGSIHITSTGGTGSSASFTYTWSPSGPNSPDNTGLTAGTYSVTVSDANSCKASLTIQLANPAPLALTYTVTEPRCNADVTGSISLITGGGTPQYSYAWTPAGPNSSTNTNLAAGAYQVTVTDSRGCRISDTVVVSEPAPMYVSGIQKNVSCHGNSDGYILPTGYGGTQPYSYQWYLGTDTFAPAGPITENITQLPGGDYYLIITDAHGCMVPFTRHIKEPDSLKATLTETDLTCAGSNTGSVKASVSGGTTPYQYLWNNFTTDSTQTGVAAGTYTVVVTDSNGCHINKSIVVNQPLPLTLTETQTNLNCNGNTNGTIAVTVQGGKNPYSYSWNTTPVQTTASLSNLVAGTYTVVVTDSNRCTLTDSFTITAPSPIEVNTAVSNPTCSGGDNGFVSLDARGGTAPYGYNWSTTPAQSGNVASALSAGTYYATITDAHGCVLLDTAVVVSPLPVTVTIAVNTSTCPGNAVGLVVVTASGGLAPYNYGLGTLTQASDTFSNLAAGNYSVVVTDVNGCHGEAPLTVGNVGIFTDTLTASPSVILAGEVVHLFANASSDTTITSYTWYPADSLDFSACGTPSVCSSPTVRPTQTQDYVVTVVNARGCSLTDTVRVYVSAQPSAFIPTGFTPNGDGLNDKFEFDILGATTVNVQIWNRWGQLVYSNPAQVNGLNGSDGWDGTFNGQPVAYDTYTYQFDVTYFDGHHQTMAGTLTVMR